MKQVLLDFLGGSHGHFLEFILNGLDEQDDKLLFKNPFSIDGSARNNGLYAHDHFFIGEKRFVAGHYTSIGAVYSAPGIDEKAITITVDDTEESYFNWVKIRLTRAWMPECSPGPLHELHDNTYGKLILIPQAIRNAHEFPDLLDQAVTLMRNLFLSINNSMGNSINIDNPSTNKWRIRNYFKQRYFSDEGKSNSLKIDTKQLASKVINFKFSYFYDTDNFTMHITRLAEEFNLKMSASRISRIKELHDIFLNKNQLLKYDGFELCNSIIKNIESTDSIPYLELIEEAYVLSLIDRLIGKDTEYNIDEFFKTPADIAEYIETNK